MFNDSCPKRTFSSEHIRRPWRITTQLNTSFTQVWVHRYLQYLCRMWKAHAKTAVCHELRWERVVYIVVMCFVWWLNKILLEILLSEAGVLLEKHLMLTSLHSDAKEVLSPGSCYMCRHLKRHSFCLFFFLLPPSTSRLSPSLSHFSLYIYASLKRWERGADRYSIGKSNFCFTGCWQQRQLKMWTSVWLTSQQAAKKYKIHLQILNLHSKNRWLQQGASALVKIWKKSAIYLT